jgi:NADH-quinone oxidoreductase subunit F
MTLSIEDILTRYTGRQRDALLPILWDIQTTYGHIDSAAVKAISHTLHVPEADIYGVISFYTMFHAAPTGDFIIRVCADPVCGAAGADAILDEANIKNGRLMSTTCLGQCEHAPAALCSTIGEGESVLTSLKEWDDLIGAVEPYSAIIGGDMAVFLRNAAPDHAQSLPDYGDYAALRRALFDLTPLDVIAGMEASGLVGRGGAGFPTGMKWRYTRGASGQPHYLICNADESEPGTFKDRVLMELRPHLLLEGMALAAYAIGAETCFLFIRGEYPEATQRMADAVAEAEAAGFLGDRVMGTDFACHVEIRRGAGAYICGEETALFEAIEGKRGFPRIKPPYPTTHGLFGKPTAINNVETLCAAPGIVANGATWWRQWGTHESPGTKLVSVSGSVNRPGVYEIPFGITLRDLLDDLCGGVVGDLQAVLMGGAAGTFLSANEIDVKLTYENLREIGGTLGSGAIMVFDTAVDLRDVLRRLGRFFEHESCGKCFPCQLGTMRQTEILERLDHLLPGDADRLRDVGLTMTESSLCGLGQTAGLAVMSAMEKWPEMFEAATEKNEGKSDGRR